MTQRRTVIRRHSVTRGVPVMLRRVIRRRCLNGTAQPSGPAPIRWLRQVRGEDGNAIIEFVFVAILVLVPLIYLIVAVATVQRARLAATNAARDVGRAIATSDSMSEAPARASAALRISLANEGLSPADVELRYVGATADCRTGAATEPSLAPGAEFRVCVIRQQRLPAVPSILSGRGIVTVGNYLVHVDDFRNRS